MSSNATKNPATERQKRARKGKNCQLGTIQSECGQPAFTTVHDVRICEKHWKFLHAIATDEGVQLRQPKQRAA